MARFPQARIEGLVAAARAFATLHPGLVGRLGRMAMDASLERIRRGVFAIGAAILERIPDFEMESHGALADVVAPSLARPFPAATIVQLEPEDGRSRRIAAGAEILSAKDPWCRFQTVSDVDVGPYRIENARALAGSLQFEVRVFDGTLDTALGEELRIYVDGPHEAALLLLAHVLRHTERVELRFPDGRVRDLDAAVRPYGLRLDEMLAPEPDGPPTATSLLQEYFSFPEKFRFFVLRLGSAHRGAGVRQATVVLRFERALPAAASLAQDGLRAHCVPAVNLFRTTAEPRMFGPGVSTFPVHVAGLPRARGVVYAVISATAKPRDRAGPTIPLPAVRRFAAERFSSDFPYAYSTRWVPSRTRSEPDLFVTLTSPRGAEPLLEPHVIALRVLATSRGCELAPGELASAGAGMPGSMRVRNILPTSNYVPPAAGADLALRAFMRGAIPDEDPLVALQNVLFSLLPPFEVDPARFHANVARIRSLEALTIQPTTEPSGSRRGYRASLELDETDFRGPGDVALFARILHRLLDAHVATNGFVQCIATLKKTGDAIRWPPSVSESTPHEHPCAARPRASHPERAPLGLAVRQARVDLFERLVETAGQYDFFAAARLLEHMFAADVGRPHRGRRPIRFGQVPSLVYPSGDVAALTVSRGERPHVRLDLRFLGLVGTSAPLAAQWTEEIVQHDDEGVVRAFYDVLHHPLAARLYAAWKARAIEGGFDLDGNDALSRILRPLAGVDAFTAIAEDPLPPMVALGLADFQRGQPHAMDVRSAEQLLQRLVPWPISLQPNIHRTVAIDPFETAQLGVQVSTLGEDMIYGDERDDTEGLVRLHVGPVGRTAYESLMPGGSAYAYVELLTRRIFDAKVAVELEVHLDANDVPAWELGARELGVETYYTTELGGSLHVRVPLLANAEEATREFVPAVEKDERCARC
ncbi:type VI secretion system baseplate subunit TssG [Pendulispora albinea]|uniref:Type VI secretion system baseplate subunit TssG n=1 Tax=Pendulispora albinea TaxID=2741071 RepID=A0ABZ2M368_9BACT